MSTLVAVGPYPAPVVNMPTRYNYTEPVTDDAQQWTESALGLDAYGATAAGMPSSSSASHLYGYPSTTQERTSYTPTDIPQQILPHLPNIPNSSPDYGPYAEQTPTHQTTPYSYGYGAEGQPEHMVYDGTTATYPQQVWNMSSAHPPSFSRGQTVYGSSQWAAQWSDAPTAATYHNRVNPTFDTDYYQLQPSFNQSDPSANMHPSASAAPRAQRFSGAALQAYGGSRQQLTPSRSGHDHRQCLCHTEMSP